MYYIRWDIRSQFIQVECACVECACQDGLEKWIATDIDSAIRELIQAARAYNQESIGVDDIQIDVYTSPGRHEEDREYVNRELNRIRNALQ